MPCSRSSSTPCSTRATRCTRTRRTPTKNATPTPFGIVYPPVYAAECDGAHDHARLECVAARAAARPDGDDALPAPERRAVPGHRAARRSSGRSAAGGRASACEPSTDGRFTAALEARRSGHATSSAAASTTRRVVAAGLDRRGALRALADLRPLRCCALAGGRFVSPLEAAQAERQHLAGARRRPDDDAILGAAIVLPDHPQHRAAEPRQPVRQHRDRGGAALHVQCR